MKDVKAVTYNNGEEDCYALVVSDHGGGSLDLLVFDPDTGAGSFHRSVPRRDPADYGPEGGGRTWH